MNRIQRNIDEAVTVLTQRPMRSADAERILIAYDIKDDFLESPQPVRFARFRLLSRKCQIIYYILLNHSLERFNEHKDNCYCKTIKTSCFCNGLSK